MYEHVADELSAATGRQVDFVAVPDEGARQGLLEPFRLLVSSLRGRGLVAHVELRSRNLVAFDLAGLRWNELSPPRRLVLLAGISLGTQPRRSCTFKAECSDWHWPIHHIWDLFSLSVQRGGSRSA
jgi:hypothetical protein